MLVGTWLALASLRRLKIVGDFGSLGAKIDRGEVGMLVGLTAGVGVGDGGASAAGDRGTSTVAAQSSCSSSLSPAIVKVMAGTRVWRRPPSPPPPPPQFG